MPTIYNINNTSSRSLRSEEPVKKGESKNSRPPRPNKGARLESISEAVSAKIARIDVSSEKGLLKAKRIFVKECLVAEFGYSILNRRDYSKIVRTVAENIDDHQDIKKRFENLLKSISKR